MECLTYIYTCTIITYTPVCIRENIHTVTVSVPGKWPRKYERVTELEDVDPSDMVALNKARDQRVRDRWAMPFTKCLLLFLSGLVSRCS